MGRPAAGPPREVAAWGPAPEGVRGNRVRTAKYTALNFVPKNLFEQFHRAANWYFVAVIVLNVLPWLEVFQPELCSVPLLCMLGATAVKDAVEDHRRYKQDRRQNTCQTLLRGEKGDLSTITWEAVRVGHVVRVLRNCAVPADLVVTGCSGESGECFVDTAALDGEASLKPRYVAPVRPGARITCGSPDPRLDRFDISVDGTVVTGCSVLLRGNSLRNTEWADGVVIYAGMDTKEVLNSALPPIKRSRLERLMNAAIVRLCGVLAAMSLSCGVGAAVVSQRTLFPTPEGQSGSALVEGLKGTAMAVILFQVMVPIALYVSLEVLRALWGWFTEQALDLCGGGDGLPACVRNATACEESGVVTHVLTDKTGTLTENRMEFRSAHCCTSAPRVDGLPHLLWLGAAACGSVRPGPMGFEGESPDEVALAAAAAAQGVRLTERARIVNAAAEAPQTCNEVSMSSDVVTVSGRAYEVAAAFTYSSERRRCGVVLKTAVSKGSCLVLLVKGAEDAIAKVCRSSDSLHEGLTACQAYASCGLRTLLFAAKLLPPGAATDKWLAGGPTAAKSGPDAEEEWWRELEWGLDACGATGVEDCLQPGVAGTLGDLRAAGIGVSMATGDRPDTAEHVARSCGLVAAGGKCLTVTDTDSLVKASTTSDCVVVTGEALAGVLADERGCAALADALRRPPPACCLLCRAAPAQKARAVKLLRRGSANEEPTCTRPVAGAVVLAVGDGGNDASMLRAAACGVAIRGLEGRGAVLASDVAVSRFRHLTPLLLVHGRWSLIRAAGLVRYGLQKNACFALVLLCYQPLCGWSLASLMDPWTLLLYNVYTAAPSMFAFAFDQDCPRSALMDRPDLYSHTQTDKPFSVDRFWLETLEATWHAVVMSFLPLHALGADNDAWGLAGSQHAVGAVQSSAIAIIQSIVLVRELRCIPTVVSQTVVSVVLLHFGVILLLHSVMKGDVVYGASPTALATPGAWITILLTAGVATLPRFAVDSWLVLTCPAATDVVRSSVLSANAVKARRRRDDRSQLQAAVHVQRRSRELESRRAPGVAWETPSEQSPVGGRVTPSPLADGENVVKDIALGIPDDGEHSA